MTIKNNLKKVECVIVAFIIVLMYMTVFTAIPAAAVTKINDDNIVYASNEIIGEIYFKEISSINEIVYDTEDNRYVKNQILLTAYDNIPFEEVEKIANDLNAEIVGYIELTNDYQIEFKNDLSDDELFDIVEMLSANPVFELVTPNMIIETVMCNDVSISEQKYFPDDSEINPLSKIDTNNWSLHAINAIDAWQYYLNPDPSVPTSTVKIGVIDGYIYTEHKDLPFSEKSKEWNDTTNIGNSHGTRVAGIIGASHNNTGIAGICPKSELYGFSMDGNSIEGIEKPDDIMKYKYAFALMISNNVKVINISLGTETIDEAEYGSKHMEKFLSKLLAKGYDFLIVNSAGNGILLDDGHRILRSAKHGSIFSCIESPSVYDHIIVVGSVNYKKEAGSTEDFLTDSDGNIILEYEFRDDCNVGDRIDIVAPGEKIMSTSIDEYMNQTYEIIEQTSAAAAQVAGVAGLIYSVNPNLTAREVKNIIIDSAKNSAASNEERKITDSRYDETFEWRDYTYYLLDAKAAIDMAIDMRTYGPFPPSFDKAIIYGTVKNRNKEEEKNTVSNAQIYVTSKTTGEEFVFESDDKGDYLFDLSTDTYDILFIAADDNVPRDWVFNGHTGWNYSNTFNHIEENQEFKVGNAYPLDVVLNNNLYGRVRIYCMDLNNQVDFSVGITDIKVEIKDPVGNVYTETMDLDDIYNRFCYTNLEDGKYTITVSKEGYDSVKNEVTASNGILYDTNGNIFDQVKLPLSKSTITGIVLEYNETTGKIKHLSDHTVSVILPNGETLSEPTNEKGEYVIETYEKGDIVIDFGRGYKKNRTINGGDYTVNACLTVKDDDNDKDNNGNDNNGDGNGDNNGDGNGNGNNGAGGDNNNGDGGDNNNGDGDGNDNNGNSSGNGSNNGGDSGNNSGNNNEDQYGAPGIMIKYARANQGTSAYILRMYVCTSIEIRPLKDHYDVRAYYSRRINYDTKGNITFVEDKPSTILFEIDSPIGSLPPYSEYRWVIIQ